MKFAFKAGYRVKSTDAAVVAAELDRIRERRGALTPRAVWEESRDSSAPLHIEFDWDDTEAAARWRDEQARGVVQAIVVIPEKGEPVRRYVHVEVEDGHRYEPLEVALKDTDMLSFVLGEAESYLMQAQRRLRAFRQFASVAKRIDAIATELKAKREARDKKRKKKSAA